MYHKVFQDDGDLEPSDQTLKKAPAYRKMLVRFRILMALGIVPYLALAVLVFLLESSTENRVTLLLCFLIFPAIFLMIAFVLRYRARQKVLSEYRPSGYNMLEFSEDRLQYTLWDFNLWPRLFLNHELPENNADEDADIAAVYTIPYAEIRSAVYDGSSLYLKGKAEISLYDKDPDNKRPDKKCKGIPENLCQGKTDFYRIPMSFPKIKEILHELGTHTELEYRSCESVYKGNPLLHRLFGFRNACRHLPFITVFSVSWILEVLLILSFFVDLPASIAASAPVFSFSDSFLFMKVLAFTVLITARVHSCRRYAGHAYEDERILRIIDDRIEFEFINTEFHSRKRTVFEYRTNEFVYSIGKEDIQSISLEGNELVITGHGTLAYYYSYPSRCICDLDQEALEELTPCSGKTCRILLSFTDRKKIVQQLREMLGYRFKPTVSID